MERDLHYIMRSRNAQERRVHAYTMPVPCTACRRRQQQHKKRRECNQSFCSLPTRTPEHHLLLLLSARVYYSSRPINPALTFVLTTPPTPNAGTIRPILASALLAQFLATWPTRPSAPPMLAPGRLYRSSPSRCRGVLTNWMAAGVTNCATLAPVTYLFIWSLMWASTFGAKSGGRLNEAKMVRESRTMKRANVESGTGRLGPLLLPKRWVNWLSL